MNTPKVYWVYITIGNIQEGRAIGRALVEARLAACVNLFPKIESIYHWNGELQSDHEAVLIAKTSSGKLNALTQKVLDLHSYDCPCVIALPAVAGHTPYLQWIESQVSE